MKRIKGLFKTLIILCVTVLIPNVYADNGSNGNTAVFTPSVPSKVNVGSSFDISVNVSGLVDDMDCAQFELLYDKTKLKYEGTRIPSYVSTQSLLASQGDGKITATFLDWQLVDHVDRIKNGFAVAFKFTALNLTSDATADFTLNISSVNDTNNKSYNVQVTPKNFSTLVHIPSTNNNLSSLSVSGGTLTPQFNKDVTKYTATVNSDTTEIYAGAESSYATIEGAGTKQLKYGDNTFNIIVTSESGVKKSYLVTINRPDNRNGDNTLKTLTVSNTNITYNGNLAYSVNVANNVTNVTISAAATNPKSVVTGDIGYRELSVGKNNFIVKVTAENDTVKNYVITIVRAGKDNAPQAKSSNNYLSSLTVEGAVFDFDKTQTNYTIYVPFTQEKLVVHYTKDNQKSTVKVMGGDTLFPGNNSINVMVTSESGDVRSYNLTIIRQQEKVVADNDVTDILEKVNNSVGNYIYVEVNNGDEAVLIDSDIIGAIKDKNKTLIFEFLDNDKKVKESITIDNKYIKDTNKSIKLELGRTITDTDLLDLVKDTKYTGLSTKNTNLPNKTLYKVYVGNLHDIYYVYYYKDSKLNTLRLNVTDGYISFEVENGIDYAIVSEDNKIVVETPKEENSEAKPAKENNIWFLLLMLLVILVIFIILSFILLKVRDAKRNESIDTQDIN